MLKSVLIKDYMTRDPLTLKRDMDVMAAIQQLIEHQLSGAPVVDAAGTLVGYFSERDGLRIALNAAYYEQPAGPVADYMSSPAITLDASDSIASAVDRLLADHHHCYPVIADGALVGQLTRRDALKALNALW